ncbi:MAG: 4Fe-4S dicluster domain-containing protein [Bryobacteraceae bacterium]
MGSSTSAKPRPVQRHAPPDSSYHRFRKWIHLVCFLIFCALPFFNLMRFDIPRQRFYFAGYELWINEFGIIFFAMMFLLFVVTAAAMVYGRVYCSYMCPQMIFSEASLWLERRLRRYMTKYYIRWPLKRRELVVKTAFYSVVLVASVFVAFVFIAYFVEPRDLLARLLDLDVVTAGGISGAATTVLAFLDFAFLRQRFCTTICPYGYLQGMLSDGNTLLVHYRDEGKACIECKKCVRICHMGIDIRTSPYQIECIHCGECIDACDDVLGRLGKPGLIHYAWGEHGSTFAEKGVSWWRRLGIRDAKRVVVLLVILFYVSGLTVALSMRRNVLVRLSPERATLFTLAENGEVLNKFRLEIANRGTRDAKVRIALESLPAARLVMTRNPVTVAAGQEFKEEIRIAAPASGGPAPGVSHFRFITESQPENARDEVAMTFIMPEGKAK